MKRFFSLLIIFIAVQVSVFSAAGGKDILSQEERQWLIKHDGKIRYALLPNYPPIEFVDSEGTHKGVTSDYLRRIEQKLDCRFAKVQANSWYEIIEKAKQGEIDVIGSVHNTPERREYLTFTKSYLEIPNAIIVREKYHRPLTLEKMVGMKIVIVKGYASFSFIKNNHPKLIIEPVSDDLTGLQMVSFGRADAIITDLSVASYLIEKMKISNLRVAGTIDYAWNITFASRKDWPILNNILEKGLAAIDQKERQAIYSKWVPFGYKDLFPRKKMLLYIAIILSITVGGIVLIFIWNRMLKRQVIQNTVQLQRELDERKRAEKAVLKSEEKYRAIFEYNPIDSIFVDNEAKIVMYNLAKEKLSARLPEIGDVMYKDYAGKHRINMFEELMECMRTGEQKEFLELKYEDRFLHIRISPFSEGAIITSIDLTETKNLHDQLRQSQKMEAIGTLAGGVAHDFNNLLTAILGYAELSLMDIRKDNPVREKIEEIKKAGNSAASLTRQLLAFSRKQIIKPVILDINEEISETEKMLKRMIGEDIEFLLVLEPELWRVYADPGQIDQVLMNLVVNARDAMPRGGKITIETANVEMDEAYFRGRGVECVPGPYVMIAVTDDGTGMDEETLFRIFDPFFTTKEIGSGTGLGLSMVYGIVKQNNGYVWVYSEPGKGTTFKISFPRVAEDVVAGKEQEKFAGEISGSETVLIVEDDDALRNLAKNVLKKYGYTILEAENGEKALNVSETYEGSIHLLLTDVVMPKMSGSDLAEKLQSIRPETRVIYMSGYTDNAIVHHGVLAPGLNFIEKPFSPEGLARKAREVLDKKQD
ncbi:MAG: transporter substrate-binding domain-containing protein [Proteobacteria bacterium]|nr:transporter substrate-binding domain-containing protein [Pseudomonadota bacterium]MBU4258785.1 transporter substrate-binding domain-containing protein [Pseudomonadota bacterium]MBU4287743.1 transporter substrate-binding domain-containing protein [Pseudomonadota bacterium]MBU4415495.1 transporter substrate-binding domain-containing protein [Pseudomonadota bacterium]MCG2759002.1 transporter substrate-binding domain-containing protein [Desulfobacteraceae bacterium]